MKHAIKTTLATMVLISLTHAAMASPLMPKTLNGINYLAGGVGEEELAQIKAVQDSYNVQLLFAEKTGAYVADVKVLISGKDGIPLATIEHCGPLVLLRLPAGKFAISATYQGKTLQQRLAISDTTRQRHTFAW